MNATEQAKWTEILQRREQLGYVFNDDADWLIEQLKAAKEEFNERTCEMVVLSSQAMACSKPVADAVKQLQSDLAQWRQEALGKPASERQHELLKEELEAAKALLASHETGDAMLLEMLPGHATIAEGIQALKDELTALKSDDALATAYACGMKANQWQPIATLPSNVIFMRLAFGPEDDQSTCDGIQWNGKFYAACAYYCLGKERPYKLEEKEVQPTHWQPLPQPPKI